MGLLVNELMEYHCKGLDKDSLSISSLDVTLHRLTTTTNYSIAVSITFCLITLLYYNISSSIDAVSDDIQI